MRVVFEDCHQREPGTARMRKSELFTVSEDLLRSIAVRPLLLLLWLSACTPADPARTEVTVGREEITVLMGSDAQIRGGITERISTDHVHRLWMENWTSPDDALTWHVHVPNGLEGEYQVSLLAASHFKMASGYSGGSSPVTVELLVVAQAPPVHEEGANNEAPQCHAGEGGKAGGEQRLCARGEQAARDSEGAGKLLSRVEMEVGYVDEGVMMQFQRLSSPRPLALPQGQCDLVLRAAAPPEEGMMNLQLLSVELAHASTHEALAREKALLEAETFWLQQADYGMFLHWNSFSLPLDGSALPYHEAVDALQVNQVADMVQSSGASFLVLTTSWAGYYFPAPIAAIDAVLPGRTCQRDLVADLIAALDARGVRLMLYYHYGKDDAAWWHAARFHSDKAFFWNVWVQVIQEVGERYGTGLAGWWVDDAVTGYYSAAPPWRRMWRALKAGFPSRLVGMNPWALPRATILADFHAGELAVTDIVHLKHLPVHGAGRFLGGAHEGLFATFSSLLQEGDWTYMQGGRVDTTAGVTVGARGPGVGFGQVTLPLPDLVRGVCEAKWRGATPILNMLITQEGATCARARELLEGLKAAVALARHGPSLWLYLSNQEEEQKDGPGGRGGAAYWDVGGSEEEESALVGGCGDEVALGAESALAGPQVCQCCNVSFNATLGHLFDTYETAGWFGKGALVLEP